MAPIAGREASAHAESATTDTSKPTTPDRSATTSSNGNAGSSPSDLSRVSTPPPPNARRNGPGEPPAPKTPKYARSDLLVNPPSTPGSSGRQYASAADYLSSPIRSARAAPFLAGTMTPGRPPLKFPQPSSPFRIARPSGRVNLNTPVVVPPLPVQSNLMVINDVAGITELDVAKQNLEKALEQADANYKAAQQFRGIANNQVFQHKLLQVESDETERRFEVESSIQQREIDRLAVDFASEHDGTSVEQLRRKLHKNKQRMKEMSDLLDAKDQIIRGLSSSLDEYRQRDPTYQQRHATALQALSSIPQPFSVFGNTPAGSSSASGIASSPSGSHSIAGTGLSSLPAISEDAGHVIRPSPPLLGSERPHSTGSLATPKPGEEQPSETSPRSGNKPRPPPIDTATVRAWAESDRTSHSQPPPSASSSLSNLEIVASEMLTFRFNNDGYPKSAIATPATAGTGAATTPASAGPMSLGNTIPLSAGIPLSASISHMIPPHSAPGSALPSAHPGGIYASSPFSSPFYSPFSPYAVPPHYPLTATATSTASTHTGSPEKRRRPSSSSTISAMSEDDTLEDPSIQ